MSAITWTAEELAEFDRLTEDQCSDRQMTRISARLDMAAFIKKHGDEKCRAMFAHLVSAEK